MSTSDRASHDAPRQYLYSALAGLLILSGIAAPAVEAATVTFSNPERIVIPNMDPGLPLLYPSPIDVTGLSGVISDVNVILHGVSHTFADDLDILLVGPTGASVILVSNVSMGAGDGQSIMDLTWTFDDSAASMLPNDNTLVSGTFQPTDYDDQGDPNDDFPAPAPAGAPTGTVLGVFNGTAPGGTWSLFVRDDAALDGGMIRDGWSVEITTVPLPAAGPLLLGALIALGGVARRRKR